MQWSKLKTRFRAFICDELRDRIDIHVTSYRESHDGAGVIWVTLDGKKLVDFEHYRFEFAEREGYHIGLQSEQLEQWLSTQEIHGPRSIGTAMRTYLDMSINEALTSPDPFHRAFAMIDRRLGKRTLEKLNIGKSEHSLISALFELRKGIK
jgi:hypothetical protein